MVQALFEGLVVAAPDGKSVVGGVAEQWSVSPDGREYRFSLRPARWSDGSAVKAGQFVAGWLNLLDPRRSAPLAWFPALVLEGGKAYQEASSEIQHDPVRLAALRNAVAVQALDDQTLWFRTSAAMPWVLQALCHPAFFPLSPKPGIKGEIGNGAFVLRDWQAGKRLVLDRSRTYWDAAKVQIERVDFLVAESQSAAFDQYDRGEADWLPSIDAKDLPMVWGRADLRASTGLESGFYLVDCRNPVLRDLRVRQALSLALDRKSLAESVPGGQVQPVAGFTVQPDGATVPESANANWEKARSLLATAGFPGGRGLPTLSLLASDSPRDLAVSSVLRSQLQDKLKITVHVRNLPRRSFLAERRLGNFDLARGGWQADLTDIAPLLETFVSSSLANDGFYNNPEYDNLLAKAAITQLGSERDKLLDAAAARLLADAGVLALYESTNLSLIKLDLWGGWQANKADQHNLKFLFRNK